MNNFITSIILFLSLGYYVFFLTTENYLLSIISISLGFIMWLICMGVLKNKITGLPFILILFGLLVSGPFFIHYAVTQDMWGGYHFNSEASMLSFGLLLLLILPGVYLFYKNNNEPSLISPNENFNNYAKQNLSKKHPELVEPENNNSLGEFNNSMVEYDPELFNSYYQYYYNENNN